MTKTVHLGFEVGTGEPVSIPVKHMVITGQTQEAGKTTTLEALIKRSGMKALAFVTKRGEGSFLRSRQVQPYFRERTDWKYVAAILEASRGEKLKWERQWIIRASKGARTLADVQTNVRAALAKARGEIQQGAYLCLDAYLDDVVPLIGQMKWAKTVDLQPGLNVMDLETLNDEMQHLVLRSSIEWMLKQAESGSLVVVPEAWKFLPEGRGTPVKLAAEAYIRQAAGLRNYLWLDSQDISGVQKLILKSCPVWLLGVQREANEIKHTLAQIPEGLKRPKASDIAMLALGQFFACWGTHIVKVYVQPAWMGEGDAIRIARGQMEVHEAFADAADVNVGSVPADIPYVINDAGTKSQQQLESEMDIQERTVYEETIEKLKRQIAILKQRCDMPLDDEERALLTEDAGEFVKEVEPLTVPEPSDTRDLKAKKPASSDLKEIDLPLRESDIEMIVERVLARIPTNGVVKLEAKEVVLKEFERAQVDRILQMAKDLSPWQKQVVRFIEAKGSRATKNEIFKSITGKSSSEQGGKRYSEQGGEIDALTRDGVLRRDKNGYVYPNLGVHVRSWLASFDPTNETVDSIVGQALLLMKG